MGRSGRVTERALADGRPIRYYDDRVTEGPVHEAADTRPLHEPPQAGEARFDVLTGEWVTVAAHRMSRTFLPSAADCPLDPTRDPARPTDVPDSDSDHDVVVLARPSGCARSWRPGRNGRRSSRRSRRSRRSSSSRTTGPRSYVPRAARWPVEVPLAPHRDVPDLAALDDGERAEPGLLYQELLRRVNRCFPGVPRVPYSSGRHQASTGPDRALGRLHLQVFSLLRAPGKLKYLAGSESGMGAWVMDTTPERIADRLREVAS